MKGVQLLVLVGLGLIAGLPSFSQAPQPASVAAQLEAMKTGNTAVIERQEKTLKALETLRGQAEQIKMFSKRS